MLAVTRNAARLYVARQVRLDSDTMLREIVEKLGIIDCTNAVPDSRRAEYAQCRPDARSRRRLSGVHRYRPAGVARSGEVPFEKLGRPADFVTGEIERDDAIAPSQQRFELDRACLGAEGPAEDTDEFDG